ncbi:MAG: protein kinase [Planctomycetia bacterium]|nr:protein kinase [Planctomycetia bacterium]
MQWESRTSFLATLESHQLLEPRQLRELSGDPDADRPQVLARRLVQRGWLTTWQVEQLENGHAAQLVLGQYLLLEPLGQGGMGVVYKARHRRLDRLDAVKLIRKEHLTSETAVLRFYQEARAAARLHHPNIVSIYDADEVAGTHYMAMEYVAGVDLAHLLKKHVRLKVVQACEYIRQAALGLQHAHERGLVHRDLKPSNLIVAASPGQAGRQLESEVIKILDMGLARLDQHTNDLSSERPMTNPGGLMGTPDYMAPEQAQDAHGVDIRADLYSLGCTLYHLLTGKVPFPGGSLLKKLDAHRSQQPQPLTHYLPQLLPEVERIVFRLMAKQPADRYQTPAELAVALSQLLLPDEADEDAPTTAYIEGAIAPPVDGREATGSGEATGPGEVTSSGAADSNPGEPTGEASAPSIRLESAPHTLSDDRPGCTVADERALQSPTRPATMASRVEREATAATVAPEHLLSASESASTVSIRPARPRPTEPSEFQLPPDPATPEPKSAAAPSSGSTAPLIAPRRRGPRYAAAVLGVLSVAAAAVAVAQWPLFIGPAPLATEPTARLVTGPRVTEPFIPNTGTTKPPPATQPKATSKTPVVPDWQPGPVALALPVDFVSGPAALSTDGRWFLIAEEVKKEVTASTVFRFALQTSGAEQKTGMEARGPIDSIAIATDGSALLGSKNMLERPVPTLIGLWKPASGLPPSAATVASPAVTALAFSARGDRMLSGDGLGNVQLWERERDALRKGPPWPQSHQKQEIRQLAFTPDGEYAVSAGRDKIICVWNVKEGRVVTRFSGHEQGFVTALAVSPVKPFLVLSGDYYGVLHLWQPLDWKAGDNTRLVQPDAKAPIRAAAFDPQGLRCVSGGDDRQLTCWDVPSRQRVGALIEHKARILAAAFAGDGTHIISAGDDRQLFRQRWPVEKPQP